jgi:two-component system cell cycle sensor histidine kinase/response regulator CckA
VTFRLWQTDRMDDARARELIERAPIGIYRTTREGRFLYANAAFARMLGYASVEELLVRDIPTQVYFDGEDRKRLLEEYRRRGELHDYDVRLRRKDETPLWVRIDMRLVPREAPGTPEMEGFVHDISESRRVEEELRKLSRAVEHSPASVVITDLKGNIEYVNPTFSRVTGYTREEAIGQNPRILKSGESPPEAYRAMWDAITHGQDWHGEFHNKRKDGTLYWEFASISPIVDASGRTTHFVAIKEDITARKEAEAALARSELYYRSLIEHALDLTAVLAPDGTVLFVSPSVVRLFGLRPEDATGRNVFELIHREDAAQVKDRIAGILARGARFEHVEFRVRHSDGSWRTLSAIGKPLPPETGIEGLIINARDLSERHELEAQLRQSQKMEAVGRLAGGVAHDFNNLLTAILGYTELLLSDIPPEDPKTAELNEILTAAQRAAALTRQLLTFSRKQVVQVEVLDVAATIRGMEQMLRRVIGEDIVFAASVPEDLGRVRADRSQIEQVLMNLVVNARDAMPKGGTLRIEASNVTRAGVDRRAGASPAEDSWVVLTVADDGTGMSEETLRHIFEPFFTTKARGKGTGLGLATTYAIVQQTGGFTEVASEPGSGTTFRVFLPRAKESPQPGRTRSGAHRTSPARGSETILLVEDEALVRKLASDVLTGRGYTVLSAASGAEALVLAEANADAIALVVSDVVMPGMSGPEMAGHLAARGLPFPVLYMSGYAESDSGALLPTGASLLQKPFSPDALARRVRAALDEAAG